VPLPDSCIAAISRWRNTSSSAQGRARALLRQWPTCRLGSTADIVRIERRQARRALGRASGRGDQGPCRRSATGSPNDPPAQRLGFLAVRCSPGPGTQKPEHDAELIVASTLLHDISLTAAFTGELRFVITFGSGLQLDRRCTLVPA
jgi:hypothetical protein